MSKLKTFRTCHSGSVATLLAMAASVLAGTTGAAIDYSRSLAVKTKMQAAVDSAAMAAASSADPSEVAKSSLANLISSTNIRSLGLTPTIEISVSGASVTVSAKHDLNTTFLRVLGIYTIPLRVTAVAVAAEAGSAASNLCILLLEPTATGLSANSDSKLAADCGLHVNSSSSQAVFVNSFGSISASNICVNGSIHSNSGGAVSPTPLTGCAARVDPLSAMPEPMEAQSACTFSNLTLNMNATLNPGVYCGNTTINSGTTVNLSPGIYVFRNGDLHVNSGSTITGSQVTLFFQEQYGRFNVNSDSTIDISAPVSGTYKGILVFQSRDQITRQTPPFIINSHSTSRLEGTIYAPNGEIRLNSFGEANQTAAYTAIIARTMALNSSGNFTVKSNHTGATPLPDPLQNWTTTTTARLAR